MSCENCEESAYVIDALAKLLAEIAVIVNGVEPHDTLWSYHDLPEKVRALKQAPPAAVPVHVSTLRWWRELAQINPADLVPRIDAMLAAANKESSND